MSAYVVTVVKSNRKWFVGEVITTCKHTWSELSASEWITKTTCKKSHVNKASELK